MNVFNCLICLSLIKFFVNCTTDKQKTQFCTKNVSVELKQLVTQYNCQFHSAIPVPSVSSTVIFRNVAVRKGDQFDIGTFFRSLTNEINSQIERYLVGNKSDLIAELYNTSIGYSGSIIIKVEEQNQIDYLRQIFAGILKKILKDGLKDELSADYLDKYSSKLKNSFDGLITLPIQFKNIPVVQRNSSALSNLNEYLKKRTNEIWINEKLESKEIKNALDTYISNQNKKNLTKLKTVIFQSFNGITPYNSKLKAFTTATARFQTRALNEEYKNLTGKTIEITLGEIKNVAFLCNNDEYDYSLGATSFLQAILKFPSKYFEELIEGKPNEIDCSKYNSVIGYNEVSSLFFTTPNELKQIKFLLEIRLSKLVRIESLSADFGEAIREVYGNEMEFTFCDIPINPVKSAYDNLSLHLFNPVSHAVIQPAIQSFHANKTQQNLNKVKTAWLSVLKGEIVVFEKPIESQSSAKKPVESMENEKTDTDDSSDIGWIIVTVSFAILIGIYVYISIKRKTKKEKDDEKEDEKICKPNQ